MDVLKNKFSTNRRSRKQMVEKNQALQETNALQTDLYKKMILKQCSKKHMRYKQTLLETNGYQTKSLQRHAQ